ncbi:ribosomal protein S18 acetylase RimI-like enzyme [Pseudomonas sp. JUb42]|jgi:ribosomal protein S18 acetylase RimI-like enzyme|nr:ribosomal protein S18 acetylase RimI-like enzyme [Pseudomonas sp. JUb42]
MSFTLRPMTTADYDAVLSLMQRTPGISIRDADSRESTERYLARNPGLSFVAVDDQALCGCLMAGHDGRRGYLQHLIVLPEYRRQGIAGVLVERCLNELAALGIHKSHVDVLKTNDLAAAYWAAQGWTLREDIDRYSVIWSGSANA